ncbi:hypothetical protein K0U07_04935 [bacterium]|nr:hypothetical protein [bacterium]
MGSVDGVAPAIILERVNRMQRVRHRGLRRQTKASICWERFLEWCRVQCNPALRELQRAGIEGRMPTM